MGLRTSLGRAGQAIAWYVRGLVREDAYERYVSHVRATHDRDDPDRPMMTEREFWHEQTDRQGTDPQGRCC